MNSWPIFSGSVMDAMVSCTQPIASSSRWKGFADRSTMVMPFILG